MQLVKLANIKIISIISIGDEKIYIQWSELSEIKYGAPEDTPELVREKQANFYFVLSEALWSLNSGADKIIYRRAYSLNSATLWVGYHLHYLLLQKE